jgi:hypothetical protein
MISKNLIIVLILILISLIVIFMIVRELKKTDLDTLNTRVESSLEQIKMIGHLSVLKASTKEIVTAEIGEDGFFSKKGKVAIIYRYDIEFKYDLSLAIIETDNASRTCQITLPVYFYDLNLKDLYIYDEQGSKFLGLEKKINLADKNKTLDLAKETAEKQAEQFIKDLKLNVEESAKLTLSNMAKGFAYPNTIIVFSNDLPIKLEQKVNK